MGVKGKRVRIIEELSETVISFQKGNEKERMIFPVSCELNNNFKSFPTSDILKRCNCFHPAYILSLK